MGLLETLHEERKARLARIKQAAVEEPEPPKIIPEPEEEEPSIQEEVFVNKGNNSFEIILFEICEYYKVRHEDILSSRRLNSIAEKRQILAYMLYLMTKLTNPQIASKLNRDPTSIGYAIHKIRNNMERYREDIALLENRAKQVMLQRGKK